MTFNKEEISDYINNGRRIVLNGAGSRYFMFSLSSNTQFTYVSRDTNVVYKIIGHKLAKGGYSGIVSDARMTVKSGSYTHNSSISNGQEAQINIAFDSPMADTNYCVSICRTDTTAEYGTLVRYKATAKTTNGFTLVLYADGHNVGAGYSVDWIAIRPNSYTREGMVEDILFSNASGVNSGTINLSGNISDYDLIEFYLSQNNQATQGRYSQVFDASTLTYLASNNYHFTVIGFEDRYIKFSFNSDSSLKVESHDSLSTPLKLHQVIGIKFGRYVSGVAVDTTVTQNSDAVVTSGAVYDALQNLPSGGGGGSSITIDSVPTENSTNAVSSGGVYTALQNLPSDIPDVFNLKTPLVDAYSVVDDGSDYYMATAGEYILRYSNVY